MHDRFRVSRPLFFLFTLLLSLLAAPAIAADTASWTPVGPWGGSIQALAVDPADAQTVYAGTSAAGVWKSSNGGSSWTATGALGTPDVLALVIDRQNPSVLYAGTDGGGVFTSRNGGATWTGATAGPGDRRVAALALDPRDPNTLWAGTASTGLFKSTDGGATWRHPGQGLRKGAVPSIVLDPRNPQVVYAAANGGVTHGVFKSTDGGATWTAMNSGLAPVSRGNLVYQVALDPAAPDVVYTTLEGGSLYRSDDGAATWTKTVLGGYPIAVGPGVIYTGTRVKSFDGGRTFVSTALGVDWYTQAIALDPQNPQNLYAGAYDGVFHSTDGAGTFQRVNRGLSATWIQNLAVDGHAPATLYAGVYGLDLEKRRSGRTWTSANFPSVGTGLLIDPKTPSILYTIYDEVQLAKSVDGGGHWDTLSILSDGCFGIFSLALDPQTPANLYAVGLEETGRCTDPCYAFRSRDAGATWSCMPSLGSGLSIAVDPLRPQTVYAATGDRAPWRSDDFGKHWGRAGSGIAGRQVSLVAASPAQSGLLFAFAHPGVYASTDGGRTFGKAGRGLPSAYATNLVGDPADPRIVYAGFGNLEANDPAVVGVYVSTDRGATWSRLGTGLPTGLFSGQLAIDPVNRLLYAGTQGAGVFQIALPSVQ